MGSTPASPHTRRTEGAPVMMDDRLFKGQIRPAAQPIGSFHQPGADSTRRTPRIGPASGGSRRSPRFSGPAPPTSLGLTRPTRSPSLWGAFNKNLTKMANTGSHLRQEPNRRGLQRRAEERPGAGVSWSCKSSRRWAPSKRLSSRPQLAKVDPIGASLLREANPWKKPSAVAGPWPRWQQLKSAQF